MKSQENSWLITLNSVDSENKKIFLLCKKIKNI